MKTLKWISCFLVAFVVFLCSEEAVMGMKPKEKSVGKTLTTLDELILEEHPEDVEIIFINNSLIGCPSGDTLARFKNLKYLMLTNNSLLKELPADLCKGLHNLFQLDLGGNKIKELPSTLLHGAPNLKILNLEYNKIKSIPRNLFDRSPHLSYLNLSYNGITELPKDVFSPIKRLGMLLLHNNSIHNFDEMNSGLNQPDLKLIYGSQRGNSKNP